MNWTQLITSEMEETYTATDRLMHKLDMVDHLSVHRAQLFYYLKLMGRPVDTKNLWGI